MKTHRKLNSLGQSGFTLMGVIVSLVMVTIVGVVLSQFAASASDLFNGVERTSLIDDSMEGLRPILSKKEACTANFLNQTVETSGNGSGLFPNITDSSGVKHIGVAQLAANGTSLEKTSYLEVGSNFRGVTLKSLHLVQKLRVATSLTLADLNAEFETKGRTTQTFYRSFPLMVVVQNGKVKECWAKKSAAKSMDNAVCAGVSAAMNGDFNGMDQTTKECGYASGSWVEGNEITASCPGGSLSPKANSHDNCAVRYPPNFQDTFQAVPVQFQNGGTTSVGREPLIVTLDPTTLTCTCNWALDLPAANYAGAKCMIYCAVQ